MSLDHNSGAAPARASVGEGDRRGRSRLERESDPLHFARLPPPFSNLLRRKPNWLRSASSLSIPATSAFNFSLNFPSSSLTPPQRPRCHSASLGSAPQAPLLRILPHPPPRSVLRLRPTPQRRDRSPPPFAVRRRRTYAAVLRILPSRADWSGHAALLRFPRSACGLERDEREALEGGCGGSERGVGDEG